MAFLDFLKSNMLNCPSKKFLHIECPGCGFQRSFIALMEGDFIRSFQLFPALIPFIIVWVFLLLHLIFKFKHGAFIIKFLFLFCAIITMFSFGIKVAKGQIFT